MQITSEAAAKLIIQQTPQACEELNLFTAEVFQTRGGRIGSGMGGVIEALWGFYLNRALCKAGHKEVEIAWIYGHEYNDFACVDSAQEWDPERNRERFCGSKQNRWWHPQMNQKRTLTG